MARKRKHNEDNAPAVPEEQPEEEDELEEEGGSGSGDGEEEKAKSKLAMRNFRSGLSGQAKADYLTRQNQYKAVYRQRKTEGAGPAPRGRRIDDDSEQEDEPEDEGAEERSPVHQLTSGSSPPPPPASSRAPKKTKSAASSSQANPPPKARRSKKPAKVRGKRKASAKGDMPDAPTTEEETEYHPPPKLTRSLREHPAPSQPASPAPSQPASPAPSQPTSPAPSQPAAPVSSTSQRTTPKKRKYHTVLCARGARCVMDDGGRIPISMHGPKRFTFRKWVPRHGNPFVTAQGKPVDEATFNAAMVTCCAKDLVHYHLKLIERGREPGILDAYLTDDEGPEQEEQNAGGINLDGFTPTLWTTGDEGGGLELRWLLRP
ncbi:hypothetical protein C8F04DRAFT_1198901 [Mycena alexandri]|uniref:Uncharacterized protein n=1 Tax=Mycena alexandri TaxID=1745969 RepID=A0AAD6WP42_9AGAR|nr:hypothetical protein C8F04DRAFT_1198901 [Mycena alexandri]